MPIYSVLWLQIDMLSLQYDVSQKLKKIKTEKTMNGPNPIAEAAIQAAKASSALQNFQPTDKRTKNKKVNQLVQFYEVSNVETIYIVLYLNHFNLGCADSWWSSLGRFISCGMG